MQSQSQMHKCETSPMFMRCFYANNLTNRCINYSTGTAWRNRTERGFWEGNITNKLPLITGLLSVCFCECSTNVCTPTAKLCQPTSWNIHKSSDQTHTQTRTHIHRRADMILIQPQLHSEQISPAPHEYALGSVSQFPLSVGSWRWEGHSDIVLSVLLRQD